MNPSNIPLGPLADKLGITLTEATAQKVVGSMPVEGNTQPMGLLNGGASMALVETLGSVGAILQAGEGRFAVGIDINGTHHKAARNGVVTGTAVGISLGKTIATYEVTIRDEAGDLVCTGRLTCLLRDQK